MMLPADIDTDNDPGPEITIVSGPRIETMTSARPGAVAPEALALASGRVVASGTVSDLRRLYPGAVVRQVDGALLVPGFNDAHCHPSFAAEQSLRVDLGPDRAPDSATALALLRERAEATPKGQWVVGAGYDVVHPPPPRLDRRSLDTVSRRHPVYVIGSSWHAAVANSRALELITADPANTGLGGSGGSSPRVSTAGEASPIESRVSRSGSHLGGTLSRDADGELDGWLYELPHMNTAWSGTALPPIPPRVLADGIREQNAMLNARGITSYTDALVTPATWAAYELLRRGGAQTARTGMLLWHAHRDALGPLPLGAGFGDEWLRFGGVKLMYDGALSGGTCLCSAPYEGPAGTGTGIQVLGKADLTEIVSDVHSRGMRACVHANGDAAIGDVLDAITTARSRFPEIAVNHRIEHCSITDDTLIARIAAAEVIPVPFGAFLRHYGDDLVRMYSADRAAAVARHRSLLAAGIPVAGSSDFPCGPVDVFTALRSLTTRASKSGVVLGERERLSMRQALWVYTVGSATAAGEAGVKGRLAPGYLADFTVLSEDIRDASPGWADRVSVVSTWVGGHQVWPPRPTAA